MSISAAAVMALREKTGLPMMECKKALEESGGDMDKAVEILRKKGSGQMDKRQERATSEGRVACFVTGDEQRAGVAEVQCETAPVANTDDFIKLTKVAAEVAAQLDNPTPEAVLAAKMPDGSGQTVNEFLTDVVNKIRENIRVHRVASLTGNVGSYQHHNGRVGVLVQMTASCPNEVKTDVCMHVAAMNPTCARREEVDPAKVEEERVIAADQAKGKPANIIDKIVEGKLNRWFGEIVLLEQPFVKDDKKSVGQMLAGVAPELSVTKYVRYEVGRA